jgi:hypothetical protein
MGNKREIHTVKVRFTGSRAPGAWACFIDDDGDKKEKNSQTGALKDTRLPAATLFREPA